MSPHVISSLDDAVVIVVNYLDGTFLVTVGKLNNRLLGLIGR